MPPRRTGMHNNIFLANGQWKWWVLQSHRPCCMEEHKGRASPDASVDRAGALSSSAVAAASGGESEDWAEETSGTPSPPPPSGGKMVEGSQVVGTGVGMSVEGGTELVSMASTGGGPGSAGCWGGGAVRGHSTTPGGGWESRPTTHCCTRVCKKLFW